MRRSLLLFSAFVAVVTVGVAHLSADRVKLRSGQVVNGSFMSADVKTVRILLDNGRIAEFSRREHQRARILPTQGSAVATAGSVRGASTRHGAERHAAQRPPDRGN